MGTLLSLPVLSYFALTSLPASATSSLSILLFSITWATLTFSYSPLAIEFVGSLLIRMIFFLLPNLIFLFLDSVVPSLSVGIKSQGAAGIPTRSNIKNGVPIWYQVIGISVLNILLEAAIQVGIEFLLTDGLHVRSALKVAATLPLPWTIIKELIRGLLIREVLTYYVHRVVHTPRPNLLSKSHKSYAHSITSPYPFTSTYDHPILYILLRFVPLYLPALVFRPHILSYLILLAYTTLETTLTHSGYNILPWIMLGGFQRRTDLHYQCHGKGNFAPWGFMDWTHGTSIGGDVVDDVMDKAGKHRVKKRGSRA